MHRSFCQHPGPVETVDVAADKGVAIRVFLAEHPNLCHSAVLSEVRRIHPDLTMEEVLTVMAE